MGGEAPAVVRFGTDGWRDVIADNFTFTRVRQVALAICRRFQTIGDASRGIAVGYDARFLSDEFARAVAEVAAAQGLTVWLTPREVPTPALAFGVVHHRLAGGIMVTASHNPPRFNGLKVKPPYGGSATEAITGPIAAEANAIIARDEPVPAARLETALSDGRVRWFDPVPEYLHQVLSLVDTEAIRRAGLAVVADPMHGAARRVLAQALEQAGCRTVQAIRTEANPGFGGVNPEPIAPNLGALSEAVRQGAFQAGFAVDGDGDRIGMMDESGVFINAHQIFALLLRHLVEHRGQRGMVVKTVSTTSMVETLARRYGLALAETPVGFKYICQHMLEHDVLIGGEESGGIGIHGHIPERDGILSALLMAEAMAVTGKTAGELVRWLDAAVGSWRYGRLDVPLSPEQREALVHRLQAGRLPSVMAGRRVKETKRLDGYKFLLEDGAWLMIRLSGTEPLVRIYAEAAGEVEVQRLLEAARHEWV